MTKLQISEARVERKNFLMDELIERIRDGRIDLAPSFRTNINKWSAEQESLFIESLLLQIPIPAFYVDASDHERWLIVDGQQRLNTIRKFLDDELVLDGLEFLVDFNGKKFSELPRHVQKRIGNTEIVINQIQPGASDQVKLCLYRRFRVGQDN